jgi:CDP-4-dehydro-6-deoxyglucose reductase
MNDCFVISLPNGALFTARRDETILAAAQRAHWLIRYGCGNGNCEVCEATLLAGSVLQRGEIIAADNGKKILLCQCTALSDAVLHLEFDPRPGSEAHARRFYAKLSHIDSDNSALEFDLPAGRKPSVLIGQFAQVETDADTLTLGIDARRTTVRKLVLKSFTDISLVVGNFYYVRYPLGAGSDA